MFQDPGLLLQKTEDCFSKKLLGKLTTIDSIKIPLTVPEPKFVEHCWFPKIVEHCWFPKIVEHCWFPKNLLDIAKAVSSQACPPFTQPSFKFEMTAESALENWNNLKSFLNLGEALENQKCTQL